MRAYQVGPMGAQQGGGLSLFRASLACACLLFLTSCPAQGGTRPSLSPVRGLRVGRKLAEEVPPRDEYTGRSRPSLSPVRGLRAGRKMAAEVSGGEYTGSEAASMSAPPPSSSNPGEWRPQPGKFLLAYCLFGRLSNEVRDA